MRISALGANHSMKGDTLIMLALVLFVAALGFGAELFPFDLWVPDVYEGTPSYVTAMLSGVNKTVALVALLEILFVVFAAYKTTFSSIALLLSVMTMFFGNLVAITQKSVKRLLAYSSISQAGYILIGFAAATQFGIEAGIFQIIAHAFMIIGALAIVLWLESNSLRTIGDYGGLNSRNRFAAASLTLLMLSMAGVPPFMGFVGKFLLFSSAIDSGMLILASIGILNSFISVFYYVRVISAMYSTSEHATLRMDPFVAAVVIAALVIILAFGIYPQPAIAAAQLASKALLGI
jgi:NADH-quinone oxidoreductase subunit N